MDVRGRRLDELLGGIQPSLFSECRDTLGTKQIFPVQQELKHRTQQLYENGRDVPYKDQRFRILPLVLKPTPDF